MGDYIDDKPDIVVRSSDGYVIASVEVHNQRDFTRDKAIYLRNFLATHGLLPSTPYFLVVSQDYGYLWGDIWHNPPDALPTYEFPMDAVAPRYTEIKPGERVYHTTFEFLIMQWLNDIANGKQSVNGEPEKTLALTGFNEAIKDADVFLEIAA